VPLPLMPLLANRITIHYIVEPGIVNSGTPPSP
jgi:hypothetical protein